MRSLKLEGAALEDGIDLLNQVVGDTSKVETEPDEKKRLVKLLQKLSKREERKGTQPLKSKDVAQLNSCVALYADQIPYVEWTRLSARIRKRRERRLTEAGVERPKLVPLQPKTVSKLETLCKAEKHKSLDQLILKLLDAQRDNLNLDPTQAAAVDKDAKKRNRQKRKAGKRSKH